MRILYHFPISPFSRKVRILLKEKNLDFEPVVENFWERRPEFMRLSPAGAVPVYIEEENKLVINESIAICEYLEDRYPENTFLGRLPEERAEVRSVANWFDVKFYNEVTRYLLDEKVIKCYRSAGEPNSDAIRAAKTNIAHHLEFIAFQLKRKEWLGGNYFSLADIAAAAQLSVIDYLSDVPWEKNAAAKEWYSIIKSRPSFRQILGDRVMGFKPPKHYSEFDF